MLIINPRVDLPTYGATFAPSCCRGPPKSRPIDFFLNDNFRPFYNVLENIAQLIGKTFGIINVIIKGHGTIVKLQSRFYTE
jgi:hypothetical protein